MDEYDVQPDRERRHPPRALDRVARGRSSDHQARGAQDAVAMCALDRFIDFGRGAEIVGGDDDALQRSLSLSIPAASRSTSQTSRPERGCTICAG